MEKYNGITKAFKKAGDYGLLALSQLTPLVPSDAMDRIEERTGVPATKQRDRSAFAELVEGFSIFVYGTITVNPVAIFGGAFMTAETIPRLASDDIFGRESIASLAVEGPYQLGKAMYNRAKASYESGGIKGIPKAISNYFDLSK